MEKNTNQLNEAVQFKLNLANQIMKLMKDNNVKVIELRIDVKPYMKKFNRTKMIAKRKVSLIGNIDLKITADFEDFSEKQLTFDFIDEEDELLDEDYLDDMVMEEQKRLKEEENEEDGDF